MPVLSNNSLSHRLLSMLRPVCRCFVFVPGSFRFSFLSFFFCASCPHAVSICYSITRSAPPIDHCLSLICNCRYAVLLPIARTLFQECCPLIDILMCLPSLLDQHKCLLFEDSARKCIPVRHLGQNSSDSLTLY